MTVLGNCCPQLYEAMCAELQQLQEDYSVDRSRGELFVHRSATHTAVA